MKGRLLVTIKLAIAVGIVAYLVSTGRIDLSRMGSFFEQPVPIATALALNAVVPLILTLRWRLLVRSFGFEFSQRDALSLTYVFLFLNTVLPAGGADIVRGFQFDRRIRPQDRAQAASTVIVDRILGMATLVLIAVAALSLKLHAAGSGPLRSIAVVLGIAVAVLFAFALLLLLPNDPARGLVEFVSAKLRIGRVVMPIYEAFRGYRHNPRALLVALGLSVLADVFTITSFIVMGYALRESRISLVDYVFIVPVGLFIAHIPIAPGGLGVGQAGFYSLFRLQGSVLGADIFSLYLIVRFLVWLPGLAIFVAQKQPTRPAPEAAPVLARGATSGSN